mgnify:CR=1 FL=1
MKATIEYENQYGKTKTIYKSNWNGREHIDNYIGVLMRKGNLNIELYIHEDEEYNESKVPQEFEVKILWGAYPENDAELQTYKFNSISEMEAFKKGISEASGWNDYQIMTEREYREWKEFKKNGYTNQ